MEELLRKYWNNTITAEEKVALLDYLKEKDIAFNLEAKNQFSKDDLQFGENSFDKQKFENLLIDVHQKIYQYEFKNYAKKKRNQYTYVAIAAASLLLIIGIALYKTIQSNDYNKIQNSSIHVQNVLSSIRTNNSDTSISYVLPDSSVVILDSHSSIILKDSFNIKERNIILKNGKAIFQVAKNHQKPFTVLAQGITTKALGTAFSVDVREENPLISILLYHGKISIAGKLSNGISIPLTILSPQEQIDVDKISGAYSISRQIPINKSSQNADRKEKRKKIHTDNFASLEFNKVALDKVFLTLEHHYNVHFRFRKKEVENLWFTGSFNKDNSLDQVLFTICQINNLSYQKEGTIIFIKTN